MAREIKTTLALDGEAAFKRAIQDASKSITQMGSALTLATAQFRQDGDAMKLMETRSKTLRAEIDQQKVIVKALEGALKDATQKYGEDSKEAEKWQAELNRAQAKLVNLETELENNNQGLDKNGRAFDSASGKAQGFGSQLSSLDKIQQSTSFQALSTALGKIESGFQSAIDKGKQFASFVWNTAVESSNHYDDLATEALKLNVPVQTLRAWETATQLIDTDTKDIAKSLVKLVNPSKQVSDALRDLGVRTTQYTGEYGKFGAIVGNRDTIDIYWDTIEAIGKLGSVQEQEAQANEIFGKSYQELLPLIKAGRAAWDAAVNTALETAPDEEAADKLTTFNDALVVFNEKLTDFKDTISSGIAPGLTDLTKAGSDFLTEMTKWAQSPEGQEKLDKLSQAISDMVSSLATEGNFNKLVEGATTVIQGFTGALQWIIDNWGIVAIGIGTIALVSGAIKIGSGVLSFLETIKLIKWLDVSTGAKGLADAFTAAPSSGWLTLLSRLMTLAPWVAGAAVLLTPTDTADDQWDSLYDAAGNVTEAGKANGLPDTIAEYDELTDAQKAAIDQTNRITDLQKKQEAALAKYIAWMTGSDYTWYSQREIKRELLDSLPGYGDSEQIAQARSAFGEMLDELYSRYQNGEAFTSSMDMSGLLKTLQKSIDENAQGLEVITDPVLPDDAADLLQNQISRITLQVAVTPVVGSTSNSQATGFSKSYTSNSNLYVQNMNMSGSADVNSLADAIASKTRRTMAGFGG